MDTIDSCCRLGAEWDNQDNIIFQSKNFFVVPSIGAMEREGYLLICSKEHYDGVGGIPDEQYLELTRVLDHVKAGLRDKAAYHFGLALTELLARWSTRKTLKQKGLAAICNLIRCPSHREAVQTILELELGGPSPSEFAWTTYNRLIRYCR